MTPSFKESAETLLQDLVSSVAPADDGHSLYETSEEQEEVNATSINETLVALVQLHQQEVLKIIGEDNHDTEKEYYGRGYDVKIRNKLRAELRTNLKDKESK